MECRPGARSEKLVKQTIEQLSLSSIIVRSFLWSFWFFVSYVFCVSCKPLVQALVTNIEHSPNKTLELSVWLVHLLRIHSSYLLSKPEAQSLLAGLHETLRIETRMANFHRLFKLQGTHFVNKMKGRWKGGGKGREWDMGGRKVLVVIDCMQCM